MSHCHPLRSSYQKSTASKYLECEDPSMSSSSITQDNPSTRRRSEKYSSVRSNSQLACKFNEHAHCFFKLLNSVCIINNSRGVLGFWGFGVLEADDTPSCSTSVSSKPLRVSRWKRHQKKDKPQQSGCQ